MSTVLAVWLALDALIWLGILVIAARTASGRSDFRVGVDHPAASDDLLVSVLIPARDEARNIVGAVQSVLAQDHVNIECIVLDDGSSDGTGDLVRELDDKRVRVIDGGSEPLPAGWLGKPWACQRLGGEASGAWLLFIDADVRLAPEAVSRAVAYAVDHQLQALSGLGQLEMVTLGEKVMQPVVSGLLLAGNRLDDVNDPKQTRKALANGQFMLFSRDGYDRVGGHEAVADNVLDDVGMAKALKAEGVAYHLVFMRHLFSCRMYESAGELWLGWRKNLFPGLEWSWLNLGVILTGHTLVVILPYLAVVAAPLAGAWTVASTALAAVISIQAVRFYMDGVFDQPRAPGQLTHGIANVLLGVLLIDSAIATTRGTATWKGRTLPTRQ